MLKNREEIKVVHEAVAAALKRVGEQHGFYVNPKRLSYDDTGFRMTLEALWAGDASKGVVDGAKREWDLYAPTFGLKPEQFGQTFTYGGKSFTVVGIKPRGSKYPVIGRRADGKQFRFPAFVLGTVRPTLGRVLLTGAEADAAAEARWEAKHS